jgi:autotransporter translocation and assembly factor TamB
VTLGAIAGSGFWRVNLAAQHFAVPLGLDLPLSDFSLSTQLAKDHLTITEFRGWNSDGELSGSGSISWQADWNLAGKIAIKHMDVSKLAPGWFKDGFVSGQADVIASATEAKALYAGAQVRGALAIATGALNGIDLERVVEGRGLGELFRFDTLTSNVVLIANRTEFSDVKLEAGAISTGGAVTLSPDGEASGRFTIQKKTTRMPLGANISVRGTAKKPHFQR